MGYGFPAAIGVQIAHPDATVVCISGDASWVMNMQEMSTAMQYRLPVKTFILNNSYMGGPPVAGLLSWLPPCRATWTRCPTS